MPVITRRFEDADLTAEWRKNANWQVVFKIKNDDGVVRDYCRETRLREFNTLEETERWAVLQCQFHKLHGAEIQLF
jgi:predicted secreted protein